LKGLQSELLHRIHEKKLCIIVFAEVRQMSTNLAQRIGNRLCEVHSFSTSPN